MVILTGQIRDNLMNPKQSDIALGLEQSTGSSTELQITWMAALYENKRIRPSWNSITFIL